MQQDWIAFTLQGLFWIVAMGATMRWLGRSRLKPRPPAEARLLRQPIGMLVIAVIGALMFTCLLIASLFSWDDTANLFTHLVFGCLTLLGLYLIADYFNSRHEVNDNGMRYGRAFRQGGSFAWSEVERVDFNRHMNWYRIRLRCGGIVRLTGTLMGLPAFAQATLQHVPVARIDSATHALLQEAARERLHPLWK